MLDSSLVGLGFGLSQLPYRRSLAAIDLHLPYTQTVRDDAGWQRRVPVASHGTQLVEMPTTTDKPIFLANPDYLVTFRTEYAGECG